MLGNISYKRKIGKNTKLLFQMQGKNHKKWWFCLGVRIGESMLGNRFLKIVQKPQKNPQKSKDLVILLLKKYQYFWKMSNNIAFFDEKMGVHKGSFAFTGQGELWECENQIMHDFQSWKMVSELKKAWKITKIDIFRQKTNSTQDYMKKTSSSRSHIKTMRTWRVSWFPA